MSNPHHSYTQPGGQEHIPLYPNGWIAIRIVQLVLSIIILAMTAYNVDVIAYDGNSLMLAVAVMCLVATLYIVLAHHTIPQTYNYWAVLGLDMLFVVLWLCAFALQASRVALLYEETNDLGYTYNYRTGKYTTAKKSTALSAFLGTQAGSAALGGVQFVLFIVSLVIGSIRLHRHRAAGFHCMPGAPRTLPGGGPAGAAVVPNAGAEYKDER
ncbi:hypothetical protein N0V88_004609 [Collariella sp. IMI 366227]|nr:hypothetical protein N0V88_004609 [Collariella sp. IMI 366227]